MATVVLDDRDPAIVYSGVGWSASGNPQAEYKATVTLGQPGGNASATLTFVGTGVTVLGTITVNTVQMSSYSIDDGVPTVFTSANASGTWYSQTFFTTGASALAPGVTHKLVVKPVQSDLWIDLITLDGAALPPPAGAGAVAGVVTGTTTPTTVEPISTPTAESSTNTTASQSPSNVPATEPSTNVGNGQGRRTSLVGPIVGGVVGGFAFACLLLVMIVYLKRSKWITLKGYPFKFTDMDPQMRNYNLRADQHSLISPYDLSISNQRTQRHVMAGSDGIEFDSARMVQKRGLGCYRGGLELEEGVYQTLDENPIDILAPQGQEGGRASPPPVYHLIVDTGV